MTLNHLFNREAKSGTRTMTLFYWIFFLLLLSVFLYAHWLFDQLVRLEYRFHRQDWLRDGKPGGFFWAPSESGLWTGTYARNHCWRVWNFITPSWMEQDATALRILRQYRWAGRIWIIGLIILAVPLLSSLLG